MTYRPRQRTRNLASERIDCELVLIDTASQRAHALNAEHAAVWCACDGTRTIAEIAGYLRLNVEGANATVAELLERDLLEPDSTIDRRAMLTGGARIGATAAVLAPIITIALPAAAAMASTVFNGYYVGQTDGYGITVGEIQYFIMSGHTTVVYVDAAGAAADTEAGGVAPTNSPYLAFRLGSGEDLSVTFMIPNGLNGSAFYTPVSSGAETPLSEGTATDLGTFTSANGTFSIHQT